MSETDNILIEKKNQNKYSTFFEIPFKNKNPNHIKFNKNASVVLIPVIAEYKYAGIFNNIWYSTSELHKIKEAYINELNHKKTNLLSNQQFC